MSKLTCEDDLYYLQWADKLRAYQEVLEWLEEGVFQPTPSEEKFKKQKSPATRAITKHQEPVKESSPEKGKKRNQKKRKGESRGVVKALPGIEIQAPKKSARKQLQSFADRLIKELKAHEFHVLRYDAKTSNSIYLKLDYGVACSIRLSDHIGYDHLHYRFNVIAGLKERKTIKHDGYERHFLTFDDFRRLVTLAIIERNLKRKRYSEANYQGYQEKAKARVGVDTKGFFSQCREV